MSVPVIENKLHRSEIERIVVLVADPDPLVRLGLESLLRDEPGVALVESVEDVHALWRALKEHPVNTVLLEVGLARSGHGSLVREIRQSHPTCQVIAMGTMTDPEEILTVLRQGAGGYLPKRGRIEDVQLALRQALVGMAPLLPEVAQHLLSHVIRHEEPAEPLPSLSAREKEVLRCLMQGMCNKEIAAALSVTDRTVKAHVSSILRKLQVADRTQAVLKAMRRREILTR